jgi:hypothetical protein
LVWFDFGLFLKGPRVVWAGFPGYFLPRKTRSNFLADAAARQVFFGGADHTAQKSAPRCGRAWKMGDFG